jgi:oligopeptide transport system ATP-binding protein
LSAQPAVTPTTDPALKSALLRVENLVKHFPTGGAFGRNVVHAVDDVSLAIQPGETLGLVGESGCGKSTLGRVIVQLQPATSGHVFFQDIDLTKVRGEKLRRTRQRIQMIFQDPYASLNPRMTVGDIVREPLRNFGVARGRNAQQKVQDVMRVVGLNPNFVNRYPHEFSGGQRQRIGIARALVLNPTFIVADEPVSALDVSIQAQIVNLMQDLQSQFNLTYLFIAHELAVVRHISDRVAVMYLGKIVEVGPSEGIRDRPLHPYTKVLQSSVPVPDPDVEAARKPILLKGEIPSPVNPPPACRFHTRCPIAQKICSEVEPPLEMKESGRYVACHFAGQL